MCSSNAISAPNGRARAWSKSHSSRSFSTCPIPSSRRICSGMSSRRNDRLRSSRAASPPVAIEVLPSRRLIATAAAASGAAACACGLAIGSHGPGRVALAAATLALALGALARWICICGRRGVVRFKWDAAGAWQIQPALCPWVPARLERASMLFRAWTLLTWTDLAGRRHFTVLDAAETGHREYATLRSRLRLERP